METSQSIDSLRAISDQLPYWTFAFASASGFYFIAGWLSSKHLSQEAKESISLWLWGDYKNTWIEQFCKSFDSIFGKRHLSLQCFWRSALVSLLSVIFLYYLFSEILNILGDEERIDGNLSFMQTLLLGAILNIIPDYLSLFETRWLLQHINKVRSFWAQCAVLILDTIFTVIIIWLAINIFQFVKGDENISVIKMLAIFSAYSVFFYSTFVTSVWAWLYCISTWVMRLFSETPIKSMLAIEEKPVEQIALVCAVFLFLALLIIQLLISGATHDKISIFDEYACYISTDTCGDVARISKNDKIALQYLNKACDGGEFKYCYKIALKYFENDNKKALKYFQKSCNTDNDIGCHNLGFLYEKGLGVSVNIHKTHALYQRSCNSGNFISCIRLGNFYKRGLGVNKDGDKARKLYQLACNNGAFIGCEQLSFMDEKNLNISKNFDKARELYQQNCNSNSNWGCNDLGILYERGLGVNKDDDKARKLFQQACNSGDFVGCSNLGSFYKEGIGVDKNINKAMALYQQACEAGYSIGCRKLGDLYRFGLHIDLNINKGRELYQTACDNGDFEACNWLGIFYNEDTTNVIRDVNKSHKLYQRACNGGISAGCINLGDLYENGPVMAEISAKLQSCTNKLVMLVVPRLVYILEVCMKTVSVLIGVPRKLQSCINKLATMAIL